MEVFSNQILKLSDKVINEIQNRKENHDLEKYIEFQGIKVKHIGGENNGKKQTIYDLQSLKNEIRKEEILGTKSETVANILGVLVTQKMFNEAVSNMNSDTFKENIVTNHLYKGTNYKPLNNQRIAIESRDIDISFIIDETNPNDKKAYLEITSKLIDKFGKVRLDKVDEEKATLGNLTYAFNLQDNTVKLKIDSSNDQLKKEQLHEILKFAVEKNSFFPSVEENKHKLQNMLRDVMVELNLKLMESRGNHLLRKEDFDSIANDAVKIIEGCLKNDFCLSNKNYEELKDSLTSEIKESIKKLDKDLDGLMKQNGLGGSAVLKDLLDKIQDVPTSKDIVIKAISRIDNDMLKNENLKIDEIKKNCYEEIEKNGVNEASLKQINNILQDKLEQGKDFDSIIKTIKTEEAKPILQKKLRTFLDENVDKIFSSQDDKSSFVEKNGNNSLLSAMADIGKSILDAIMKLFKEKEVANTLTQAVASALDKGKVMPDKNKEVIEKFLRSSNSSGSPSFTR